MAGASLLALLDDIASTLDDVAAMSKVAVKKTAGVLGDDLALNAQQVNGVNANRELPVVWKVFKGSLVNKAIIVPAALGLSFVAPWAITPILMAGGLYLCYEGAEKLMHSGADLLRRKGLMKPAEPRADEQSEKDFSSMTPEQMTARENEQVKGAVRTDFILSAEIVVIALGTMTAAPFLSQVFSLSAIGVAMTVGVYGAVAGIVKMDDVGLLLKEKESPVLQKIGDSLVKGMGPLMKGLAVVGTAAMFMVGGGIIAHAFPALAALHGLAGTAVGAAVGVAAGFAAVAGHSVFDKVRSLFGAKSDAPASELSPEPAVEPEPAAEPSESPRVARSVRLHGPSSSFVVPSVSVPSSVADEASAEALASVSGRMPDVRPKSDATPSPYSSGKSVL